MHIWRDNGWEFSKNSKIHQTTGTRNFENSKYDEHLGKWNTIHLDILYSSSTGKGYTFKTENKSIHDVYRKNGRIAADLLSEILQAQRKVITVFNVLKVKCCQPPKFYS